ncbi:DNA-binding transcriptional regulator, Lrp family [Aureimonas altamirensis DSM 21988]|uniref:AsnC family transcriptional regulator n=2 Tax=Aureimonas altamirensis TaxID=370622 RepID=A0A0P0YY18_9HYPH|nr:Lrp/AsnC family transcriptional regulator [Aureimonas altamirensis]BAT26424.1 AsnC family transcriptional regulator [Aureimonas altamirensis]SHJ47447.1 DNA-binding transcriptional regulator, Lrp family [Aureimonas altamirensis DSM 21988]
MSVSDKETDVIRQVRHHPAELDRIDRKILGALAEDASRSYAELSGIVNLSAPAVHDRVKRLKRDGVIKGTVAVLDGCKLGRTLLTFLVVDTSSYSATRQLLKFADRPEVEELHTVAGDGCVLIKVRAADTEGLESFLMEIQSLEGVRSVRSYITLSTFLERGPTPGQGAP